MKNPIQEVRDRVNPLSEMKELTEEFRQKLAALDDLPAIRAALETLVELEQQRQRRETGL